MSRGAGGPPMPIALQLRRFLIVGCTTVAVDFASYALCLALGAPIDPSKAAGFVVGTFFAYLANRFWTFEAANVSGRLGRFLALYLATLVVNVGVNAALVALLGTAKPALALAFAVATGVSASLNFLGMRRYVFRP